MENQAGGTQTPQRSWPLFLVGLLIFLLGPAIYAAMFFAGRLWMPWHMPILATIGVLFLAAWAWRRAGVLRFGVLALFVLVCGFAWLFVLYLSRTPLYTGPAQVGGEIPAFAATFADGRAFTNRDLENGGPTVLLFFRGRW